jgi:hypothetical protein
MNKEVKLSIVVDFYFKNELVEEFERDRKDNKPDMSLETYIGWFGYKMMEKIMGDNYTCTENDSYLIGTEVKITEKN